jgi:hypothetical protein
MFVDRRGPWAIQLKYFQQRQIVRNPLFVCFCLVWFLTDAYGCECIELGVKESRSYAIAVFEGTVISVLNRERSSYPMEWQQKGFDQEAQVEVVKVWKGRVARRVRVRTVAEPGMCGGYGFTTGQRYVIYARACR